MLGKPVLRIIWWLCVLVILQPSLVRAGEDEDEVFPDLLPGLVAHHRISDGTQLTEVEESVALTGDDARRRRHLATGPVPSRWLGKLFTIVPGEYTLRVFAAGRVRIEWAGHTVLDSASENPAWLVAAPVQLQYGYHSLTIDYRPANDAGSLALFWSGPRFGVEPVPARRLFHSRDEHPAVDTNRGRQLVRALRCGACHELPGEPPPLKAPSLDRLRGNVHYEWLVEKIVSHSEHSSVELDAPIESRDKMPCFPLEAGDAEAIAGWLWAQSAAAKRPPDKHAAGNAHQGERLFHTLGCLACHQLSGVGGSALYGGGDLAPVADKHPPDFFARWLADPTSVNPDHRMPRFELSGEERAGLSSYLATLSTADKAKRRRQRPRREDGISAERIQRGGQLAAEHRCGACHVLPGPPEATKPTIAALKKTSDWKNSCTGALDKELRRPAYRLTATD